MSSARSQELLNTGRVLHWVACLLGTALVGLFVVFVIGNQPPIDLLLRPESWALWFMVAGFLYSWRNDLVGGVMSVAGTAAFYFLNYEQAGNFPGGWVFPLCFIPGVLAIVASLMRSRTRALPR